MNKLMLKTYVKAQYLKCRMVERFHRDERGAGAAEYGMIIGIAVVLGIAILRMFWGENEDEGIRSVFANIRDMLIDATSNHDTTMNPE